MSGGRQRAAGHSLARAFFLPLGWWRRDVIIYLFVCLGRLAYVRNVVVGLFDPASCDDDYPRSDNRTSQKDTEHAGVSPDRP
jgi:hypothetical protein